MKNKDKYIYLLKNNLITSKVKTMEAYKTLSKRILEFGKIVDSFR